MADRYKSKETQFINLLFEGLSEKDIDDAYRIISKIENNLIKMEDK